MVNNLDKIIRLLIEEKLEKLRRLAHVAQMAQSLHEGTGRGGREKIRGEGNNPLPLQLPPRLLYSLSRLF